jgi:hypothetical protein
MSTTENAKERKPKKNKEHKIKDKSRKPKPRTVPLTSAPFTSLLEDEPKRRKDDEEDEPLETLVVRHGGTARHTKPGSVKELVAGHTKRNHTDAAASGKPKKKPLDKDEAALATSRKRKPSKKTHDKERTRLPKNPRTNESDEEKDETTLTNPKPPQHTRMAKELNVSHKDEPKTRKSKVAKKTEAGASDEELKHEVALRKRIHEFVERATERFLETLPENMQYLKDDLPLFVVYGPKYHRVKYRSKSVGADYTYAVIERETGHVFRPKTALDGAFDRKSAIPKGSVWNDDFGASRATYDGMEREPTHGRPRSTKSRVCKHCGKDPFAS